MDILHDLAERNAVKRRSSRACDQCRKTKGKCERRSMEERCGSCKLANLECTTVGPNLKRGPPKGYLRAVETHLHEVEALLGIILAIPDPNLRHLLKTIAEDPFAHTVMSRVDKSPFGPGGRGEQVEPKIFGTMYASKGKDSVNPFVVGPTNKWQDHVLGHVAHSLGDETGGRAVKVMPLEFNSTERWLDHDSSGDLGGMYNSMHESRDGMTESHDSPVDSTSGLEYEDASAIHNFRPTSTDYMDAANTSATPTSTDGLYSLNSPTDHQQHRYSPAQSHYHPGDYHHSSSTAPDDSGGVRAAGGWFKDPTHWSMMNTISPTATTSSSSTHSPQEYHQAVPGWPNSSEASGSISSTQGHHPNPRHEGS